MRINAVVFLVLALLPLFATCTDDIAFWTSNGHYYQWVPINKSLSYNDAKTMAASYIHNSKQGYIVTLGSADESTFLLSYLSTISWVAAPGGDYPTVWGGATMSSNQWAWNALGRLSSPFFDSGKLTCYSYGFCNWYVALTAANFPSSLSCLQIFLSNTSGSTVGTWRPAACTGLAQGLVIEYDASQTCDPGYVYKTSVGWCVDVNECTNSPGICGKGYNCVNTIGSYECDDINECQNTSICSPGFQCVNSPGSYSCNDINECLQSPPVCGSGYSCQNTIGSYQCNDINECQLNSSLCGKGYVCQNVPGSYQCNDINECMQAQKVCPFYTQCSNTIGSYTCDTRYFYIQSAWNQLVLDYIIDSNGIYRIITNNLNASNPFDQLWSYNPDGFLMNRQSGYVCDAEGGLVYPGVMAILWPQKEIQNANNQLWTYNSTNNIDYWYSQTAYVVLDIYHGVYDPGAFVCLFTPKDPSDSSGNANQQWNIVFYSS